MNSLVGIVFILVFVNSIFLAEGVFLFTDKISQDELNPQSDQSSGRDDIRHESSHGYLLSFSDIELLFDSQNSLLQELLSGQIYLKKQNENFMKKHRSLRRYLKRINRACACRSQQIKKAIPPEYGQSIRRKDKKRERGNRATLKSRKENVKENDGAKLISSFYQKGAINEREMKSEGSGQMYHLIEKSSHTVDEGFGKHDKRGTAADTRPPFYADTSASYGSIQDWKPIRGDQGLHISTPESTDIRRNKFLGKKETRVHYDPSVNHDYKQSRKTNPNHIEIDGIRNKHPGLSSIDTGPLYYDKISTTSGQSPKLNDIHTRSLYEGVRDITDSVSSKSVSTSDSLLATEKRTRRTESYSTTDISLSEGAEGYKYTAVPTSAPIIVGEADSTIENPSLSVTSRDKSSRNDPIEYTVQDDKLSRSPYSKSNVDPEEKLQLVTKSPFVHSTNAMERPVDIISNIDKVNTKKFSSISGDLDIAVQKELGQDLTEKLFELKSTNLHYDNALNTRNNKDQTLQQQQIQEPDVQTHIFDDLTSTTKPNGREKVTGDKLRGVNTSSSSVHRHDNGGDNTDKKLETKKAYSNIFKAKPSNVNEEKARGKNIAREFDIVNIADISNGNKVDGEQQVGTYDETHSRDQIDNRNVVTDKNENVYNNEYFNKVPSEDNFKDLNTQGGPSTLDQTKQNDDVLDHDRGVKTPSKVSVLNNSVAVNVSNIEITTTSMVTDEKPHFIQSYDRLYEKQETGSVEKSVNPNNMRHGSNINDYVTVEDRSNSNHFTTTRNTIDRNNKLVTFPNTEVENKHISKTESNTLNEFDVDISGVRGSNHNNGFNLFDELKRGKHGVKWNYHGQENSLKQEITATAGSKQTHSSDKQASIGAYTSNQTSYDALNKEAGGRGQSSGMNNNIKGGFYDLEVDLSTGQYRGNHFAITWVSNLTRGVADKCGVQGVVQLSFPYTLPDEVQETIMIDMWFNSPTSWIFNIGDSRSNDGFSGDAGTQENDCEAEGHGTTFAVHGSDKSQDPLNKLLKVEEGFLNKTASFLVTNEQISWKGQDESNYTQLKDRNLFALKGQSDKQGSVNYDVYVSMNRVIAGNYRQGHGLCWIGFKWLTATK